MQQQGADVLSALAEGTLRVDGTFLNAPVTRVSGGLPAWAMTLSGSGG